MDARTRAQCTNIQLSKKVTAMYHFTARGLDKNNNIHIYILEQNPKSGYIHIQFMLLAVVISRV